jgi:hypothetical protein
MDLSKNMQVVELMVEVGGLLAENESIHKADMMQSRRDGTVGAGLATALSLYCSSALELGFAYLIAPSRPTRHLICAHSNS